MAIASVTSGLAVALGAFGAHALRATLEANGRIDVWQTAVQYHLTHGLALLALGIWMRMDPTSRISRALRTTGILWVAGVLCFSGSLYALGLGAPKRLLGPITPLGGLCLLAGWLLLALAAFRGLRPPGESA